MEYVKTFSFVKNWKVFIPNFKANILFLFALALFFIKKLLEFIRSWSDAQLNSIWEKSHFNLGGVFEFRS